jgi:hypothetical protein
MSLVIHETADSIVLYQDIVDSCDFWTSVIFWCCCCPCFSKRDFHYKVQWTIRKDGTIEKAMKHFLSSTETYVPHRKWKLPVEVAQNDPCYLSTNISESDCISFRSINLDIPGYGHTIPTTTLEHHLKRINQFLKN